MLIRPIRAVGGWLVQRLRWTTGVRKASTDDGQFTTHRCRAEGRTDVRAGHGHRRSMVASIYQLISDRARTPTQAGSVAGTLTLIRERHAITAVLCTVSVRRAPPLAFRV